MDLQSMEKTAVFQNEPMVASHSNLTLIAQSNSLAIQSQALMTTAQATVAQDSVIHPVTHESSIQNSEVHSVIQNTAVVQIVSSKPLVLSTNMQLQTQGTDKQYPFCKSQVSVMSAQQAAAANRTTGQSSDFLKQSNVVQVQNTKDISLILPNYSVAALRESAASFHHSSSIAVNSHTHSTPAQFPAAYPIKLSNQVKSSVLPVISNQSPSNLRAITNRSLSNLKAGSNELLSNVNTSNNRSQYANVQLQNLKSNSSSGYIVSDQKINVLNKVSSSLHFDNRQQSLVSSCSRDRANLPVLVSVTPCLSNQTQSNFQTRGDLYTDNKPTCCSNQKTPIYTDNVPVLRATRNTLSSINWSDFFGNTEFIETTTAHKSSSEGGSFEQLHKLTLQAFLLLSEINTEHIPQKAQDLFCKLQTIKFRKQKLLNFITSQPRTMECIKQAQERKQAKQTQQYQSAIRSLSVNNIHQASDVKQAAQNIKARLDRRESISRFIEHRDLQISLHAIPMLVPYLYHKFVTVSPWVCPNNVSPNSSVQYKSVCAALPLISQDISNPCSTLSLTSHDRVITGNITNSSSSTFRSQETQSAFAPHLSTWPLVQNATSRVNVAATLPVKTQQSQLGFFTQALTQSSQLEGTNHLVPAEFISNYSKAMSSELSSADCSWPALNPLSTMHQTNFAVHQANFASVVKKPVFVHDSLSNEKTYYDQGRHSYLSHDLWRPFTNQYVPQCLSHHKIKQDIPQYVHPHMYQPINQHTKQVSEQLSDKVGEKLNKQVSEQLSEKLSEQLCEQSADNEDRAASGAGALNCRLNAIPTACSENKELDVNTYSRFPSENQSYANHQCVSRGYENNQAYIVTTIPRFNHFALLSPNSQPSKSSFANSQPSAYSLANSTTTTSPVPAWQFASLNCQQNIKGFQAQSNNTDSTARNIHANQLGIGLTSKTEKVIIKSDLEEKTDKAGRINNGCMVAQSGKTDLEDNVDFDSMKMYLARIYKPANFDVSLQHLLSTKLPIASLSVTFDLVLKQIQLEQSEQTISSQQVVMALDTLPQNSIYNHVSKEIAETKVKDIMRHTTSSGVVFKAQSSCFCRTKLEPMPLKYCREDSQVVNHTVNTQISPINYTSFLSILDQDPNFCDEQSFCLEKSHMGFGGMSFEYLSCEKPSLVVAFNISGWKRIYYTASYQSRQHIGSVSNVNNAIKPINTRSSSVDNAQSRCSVEAIKTALTLAQAPLFWKRTQSKQHPRQNDLNLPIRNNLTILNTKSISNSSFKISSLKVLTRKPLPVIYPAGFWGNSICRNLSKLLFVDTILKNSELWNDLNRLSSSEYLTNFSELTYCSSGFGDWSRRLWHGSHNLTVRRWSLRCFHLVNPQNIYVEHTCVKTMLKQVAPSFNLMLHSLYKMFLKQNRAEAAYSNIKPQIEEPYLNIAQPKEVQADTPYLNLEQQDASRNKQALSTKEGKDTYPTVLLENRGDTCREMKNRIVHNLWPKNQKAAYKNINQSAAVNTNDAKVSGHTYNSGVVVNKALTNTAAHSVNYAVSHLSTQANFNNASLSNFEHKVLATELNASHIHDGNQVSSNNKKTAKFMKDTANMPNLPERYAQMSEQERLTWMEERKQQMLTPIQIKLPQSVEGLQRQIALVRSRILAQFKNSKTKYPNRPLSLPQDSFIGLFLESMPQRTINNLLLDTKSPKTDDESLVSNTKSLKTDDQLLKN